MVNGTFHDYSYTAYYTAKALHMKFPDGFIHAVHYFF